MKLHEVLMDKKVRCGDKWFRPVGYASGQAFLLQGGHCYRVPSSRGGDLWITTRADTLAGEWEIVDPDAVML